MFVKNPEYFLAIVKERSISKAADRLYLSQPYLSQYLAKLEANLGVTLLDRSHTPLRLTAAGELFHAYLERQGYLDRQLESDLQQLQEKKRPTAGTSACPPGEAPPCCPISCPALPPSTPTCRWSSTRRRCPSWAIWPPAASQTSV